MKERNNLSIGCEDLRYLLLFYSVFVCMPYKSFLVGAIVCLIQVILFAFTQGETMAGQEGHPSVQWVYWDSLQESLELELLGKSYFVRFGKLHLKNSPRLPVRWTPPPKQRHWKHLCNLQLALLQKSYLFWRVVFWLFMREQETDS